MILKPYIKMSESNPDIFSGVKKLELTDMAKYVLANRASKYQLNPLSLIEFDLTDLDHPSSLPDIDTAADRIVSAIINHETIAIETDHDSDGCTSHAVIYSALVDYFHVPPSRVLQYIGHRLNEGYGLSMPLCHRILSADVKPSLIITADNGSSDAERISLLKQHGIDVIVTDHHAIPVDGIPADAVACVSPAREDSLYPDPYIAGVMVAWLTMCTVRIKLDPLVSRSIPKLTGLLDYVAVGTIADCVSIARSKNNRLVIRKGLSLINNQSRPCWSAFIDRSMEECKEVTATDIAFKCSPPINACGRIDDAMLSVRYMLSPTYLGASQWFNQMLHANEERKRIEKSLKVIALDEAFKQVTPHSLTVQVLLGKGHAGVHGIVASRLLEVYGRPTICFSEKAGEPGVLSASCRSIDGINIREALQTVSDQHPGIFLKMGGHSGAAGLSLKASDFETLRNAFEIAVSDQINTSTSVYIGPIIHVDACIPPNQLTVEQVEGLDKLEPFGREFEKPIFVTTMFLTSFRVLGSNRDTISLNFSSSEFTEIRAIWFGVNAEQASSLQSGTEYRVVYSPEFNYWKGVKNLQLNVKTLL